jgi:hypothetical protein
MSFTIVQALQPLVGYQSIHAASAVTRRAEAAHGRIRREVQPVRAAMTAFFLLTCFAASSAQEQTGTVIFYREPHFAGSSSKPPWVFCDGVELARSQNGTYFQISAPAGPHNCTAESLQRPVIDVNVLPGQAAYVHVEIQPGFKDHAVLANTTESQYDKQKARLKPLKEWSRNALRPARAESADSSQAPAAP